MWEFCIISKNNIYIELLEKSVSKPIKKLGGLCTTLKDKVNTKLLIACKKVNKGDAIELLDDAIANLFVNYYKEEFLEQNLNFLQIDEVNYKAFIKALTYFDRDYDKQFVKRKLCYKDELYLDSFFAFKLSDLKNKWKEICSLTNENSSFLNSKDTFFELLKFLIANLKIKNQVINVVYKKSKFKFLNSKREEIKLAKEIKKQDDTSLITTLISLSPANINIYSDNTINAETINLISELFLGKVNFCKE